MANDSNAEITDHNDLVMALEHLAEDLREVLEAADNSNAFSSLSESARLYAALAILRKEPISIIAVGNAFDGLSVRGPIDCETFNSWPDEALDLDKLHDDWTAITVAALD